MHIKEFRAENVKKLTVVDIKPDGSLVQICGPNGSGKSSVLDSIWYALAGERNLPTVPIRKGAEQATIRLDLGDVVVTRTFRHRKVKDGEPARKPGEDYTTSVVVEAKPTKEGQKAPRYASPQQMLDGLLGTLTFDPLAFSRMPAAQQFATLRSFVPGVDFAAIDRANKTDFDARTDVTRKMKEAQAAAHAIADDPTLPEQAVDEDEIVGKLTAAAETNSGIEREKARRASLAHEAESLLSAAIEAETLAANALSESEAKATRIIEEAERAAAAERARGKAEYDQHSARSLEASKDAKAIADEMTAAPPIAEPVNAEDLRNQLERARVVNRGIERRNAKADWARKAEHFKNDADALTAKIDARNAEKIAAIEAAKMPVEGLGFGDGIVLLNGLPLDQASDAEQLRLSCAVAMAQSADLKVIRVRDGSLLDEDGLAIIAKMAEERGYQVWIERVHTTGKVGVVLEDGHVRGDDEPSLPLEEAAS